MPAIATLAALLSVLISGPFQPQSAKTSSPLDPQVETALRLLFEAEAYDQLASQPARWRSDLSPAQRKSLVANLLPYLWSRTSLALRLPEGVIIEAHYDWTKGYPEEVRRARQRIRHDLLTQAGRASWAIEELLLCALPVVSWAGADEAARSAAIAKSCQHIVQAMEMPIVDGTERAGVEQRRAAAASTLSSTRLLEYLAKDDSAEVRAVVAANPATPLQAILNLIDDPDESVRTAAQENLKRARTDTGE